MLERRVLWALAVILAAASSPALAENADRPMYYLESFGSPGREIVPITWGLAWLSVAVVAVIALLVAGGVLLRARRVENMRADYLAVTRSHDRRALRWVYGGVAVTVAILAGFVVWTMDTLAAIRAPAGEPAFTIEITGHQWWWEVAYKGPEGAHTFETANEIHVPVGETVRLVLNSADVIHSFWVPAIAGKTDLIPGQTNIAWIRADVPGVYRGQCAEYCGEQHAHMAMRLFADLPDAFRRWWDHQLEPAPEPADETVALGRDLFRMNCGVCHTVRGTLARGEMGPDLSHLMDRTTIASGMLPNTPGHLSGWIINPERIKPGTKMPRPGLSGPEADAIRAYLLTLE